MSEETVQQEETPESGTPVRRPSSRVRRFFLRHVPLAAGGGAVLLALLLVGFYFYASSDRFQNLVRLRLERELADATGGRVEIGAFRWRLLDLEAEADGVVIHGREAASEQPYARIEHLRAKVSILGILSPSVRLTDLEVERPALHLIVYTDGTTNQPQPRSKSSSTGEPAIDQFFDIQVGHVAIKDGLMDYDNRAATYDFQVRRAPLDLDADEVSVRLTYVAAIGKAPEKYVVDLGATDMTLVRGAGKKREREIHGRMQGTLELTRAGATLRQFSLSDSHSKGGHTLQVTGTLEDFKHPHWQATIQGDLDMELLEPALGYPFAPEGIAHLNVAAKGTESDFAVDGRLHVTDGEYVGPGVSALGITLDARVHADYDRLLIDETVVRFRQGGEMTGTVDLHHWRPPREPVRVAASPLEERRGGAAAKSGPSGPVSVEAADQTIPVDGKVTAELKNLSLDTVLDVVGAAPFKRLGIGALLNGPANATWSKGDNDTVVVSTRLVLNSPGISREAPTNGLIDATYTNKDGAVEVRALKVAMPGSTIEASGHLGAYPMTTPTSLRLSLHSQKLEEFDTVLRDLQLEHAGRVGSAALPLKLTGQADFNGTWNGTVLQPRIAGSVKASQVALEVPGTNEAATRFVNFDTVDAAGSYAAERISIDHAALTRGAARFAVSGTLDASQVAVPSAKQPQTELVYNGSSMLHANMQASHVGVDDLQMFVSGKIPATGTLDSSFEVHGPLSALDGSGSVQLANGTFYGQAVTRARAQGALQASTLRLTDLNASTAGGSLQAQAATISRRGASR